MYFSQNFRINTQVIIHLLRNSWTYLISILVHLLLSNTIESIISECYHKKFKLFPIGLKRLIFPNKTTERPIVMSQMGKFLQCREYLEIFLFSISGSIDNQHWTISDIYCRGIYWICHLHKEGRDPEATCPTSRLCQ